MDTIHNVRCQLSIPYAAAARPAKPDDADPQPKHQYQAIAISPGTWNGVAFRAEVLDEMVAYHNTTGTTGRIRIVAEHDDSIPGLIGRTVALDMGDIPDVGPSSLVTFDLFDGTQTQRDIITQLEQAPDLIGLSICAAGNLIPTVDDKTGEVLEWAWQQLRLEHIALVTWPACDTTAGTITAAYRRADGSEFNPAIFTAAPTDDAMTPNTDAAPQAQPDPAVNLSQDGDGTKYAAALDLAHVISLSKGLGIDPNADLLATFTVDQARAYAAELSKIAAARQTAAPAPAPEEKGSEYGAAETDASLDAAAMALLSGDFYRGGAA